MSNDESDSISRKQPHRTRAEVVGARGRPRHPSRGESHRLGRAAWLRAAILGANDGIISTASLVLGVSSASASPGTTWLAGVAGLVAGALSMAAGEYVSVAAQADAEQAELAVEARELAAHPESERQELAAIYRGRGLEPGLARQVAKQLMDHSALDAHARDELGLTGTLAARPVQAALASGLSFAVGASIPLILFQLSAQQPPALIVSAGSIAALWMLGMIGARLGGAQVLRAGLRVAACGALAMGLTSAAGKLFGASG
jgi:VIT1/CCC1 family predicted Fe2+/Mn2+ transporter